MILVLADDLTGALEAGAVLRGAGIDAAVVAGAAAGRNPAALVIDTESRHLSPGAAADQVRLHGGSIPQEGLRLIYKKTDSTLRGNIGAEFEALVSLWPGRTIHYAPAYPALGRTVRSGRLSVCGIPVNETAFARDPLSPVAESDIALVIAGQCSLPPGSIEIFDGETDADLHAAARQVLVSPPPVLAAGPAALLGCLAEAIDCPRLPQRAWPRVPKCVVVNGSLHDVSAGQVAAAVESGLFTGGWRLFQPAVSGRGPERAASAGLAVRDSLRRDESLIVFGGDTAFGVLRAFGLPEIDPFGEILPGVPVSRFESRGREVVLVTKAGGFGAPDLLVRLHKMLAG